MIQQMWKNHWVIVVFMTGKFLFSCLIHISRPLWGTYPDAEWAFSIWDYFCERKYVKAFCVLLITNIFEYIYLSTFYWTKLGPIQLNTMRRYPNQGDQEITGTSCHNHAFILHLRSSYRPGICVKNLSPEKTETN